jgi:hypothetical protein
MIVRIWEAQVAPKMVPEFCAVLQAQVMPQLVGLDGYLGGELLRSIPDSTHRVLVVTRWRDEESLRGYAGPMWEMRPVWPEDQFDYLDHPPAVAHFTVLTSQ